jgi:hypothetical protein
MTKTNDLKIKLAEALSAWSEQILGSLERYHLIGNKDFLKSNAFNIQEFIKQKI